MPTHPTLFSEDANDICPSTVLGGGDNSAADHLVLV